MTRFITRKRRVGLMAILATLLLIAGMSERVLADPEGPTAREENIARIVSALLQQGHLSKHPLDDEISQRALNSFLERLDPWKVYFLQSDIDRFETRANDLDDLTKRGDITVAYEIYETLLQRIDERIVVIEQLLSEEHDFTVQEEMLKERDLAEYAKTKAESR